MQAEQLLQQSAAIKAYILDHSPPQLRAMYLNQQAAG